MGYLKTNKPALERNQSGLQPVTSPHIAVDRRTKGSCRQAFCPTLDTTLKVNRQLWCVKRNLQHAFTDYGNILSQAEVLMSPNMDFPHLPVYVPLCSSFCLVITPSPPVSAVILEVVIGLMRPPYFEEIKLRLCGWCRGFSSSCQRQILSCWWLWGGCETLSPSSSNELKRKRVGDVSSTAADEASVLNVNYGHPKNRPNSRQPWL